MRLRPIVAALAVLISVHAAGAAQQVVTFKGKTVGQLPLNTTSPIPPGSCFYVDQGPGADTKLCFGYAAAIQALSITQNLADLGSVAAAVNNLGLGPASSPTFFGLTLTSLGGGGTRCVQTNNAGQLSAASAACGAGGGGGGGINQLTTDVLAGPGSGAVAATVAGLQGRPVSNIAPSSGQCLGWNGSTWMPVACGGGGGSGITQLTGPVTAGPGSGSQAATITATGVTPGSYTLASGVGSWMCQTIAASGQITSMVPGVCGGGGGGGSLTGGGGGMTGGGGSLTGG